MLSNVLRRSFLCAVVSLAGASACLADVSSPLVEAGGGIPGLVQALSLDKDVFAGVGAGVTAGSPTIMHNFVLGDGSRVDLSVERFEVFAPGAARVVDASGEHALPQSDLVLLRGSVVGAPESRVFLALSELGCNGYILMNPGAMVGGATVGKETHIVAAARGDLPTCVYQLEKLPEGLVEWELAPCGGAVLPEGYEPGGFGDRTGPGNCRLVTLAIESDYEYGQTGAFGGNMTTASNYIGTLIAGVSEIYRAEFGVQLRVDFSRVWATNTDPYPDGSTINTRLTEFRTEWNANMTGQARTLTHMFSGRRSGAGGIAYLDVLCNSSYRYGVSGWLNGTFPHPLVNNHGQNWDIVVVAHEMGHNHDAPHTHDMTPPVDSCGLGDCTLAAQGTIMSYCHTCAGGMTNIALTMGPRILNERIIPNLASSDANCVATITGVNITAQPGNASVASGATANFSVSASGSPTIAYSWRKNGVALSNGPSGTGSTYSGTTGFNFAIAGVGAADVAAYSVVVSNLCGQEVSNNASLSLTGAGCDTIDFNGDGLFPDTGDIDDFLSVFSGGPCSTGTCGDIDFNNDGLLPDTTDIDSLLSVFSGGPCI